MVTRALTWIVKNVAYAGVKASVSETIGACIMIARRRVFEKALRES